MSQWQTVDYAWCKCGRSYEVEGVRGVQVCSSACVLRRHELIQNAFSVEKVCLFVHANFL